jgi:hypothetical protein
MLSCHLERGNNPVPAGGAGAAQGISIFRRSMQRLVYNIDHIGVRVPGAVSGNPLLDLRALIRRGQAADPPRLLLAPYKNVMLERITVGLREVIRRIQLTPIHDVTAAFHRTPFSGVLRRYLIPVGTEIRRHAAGNNIAQELGLPIGQLRESRQWKQ